MFVLIVISRCHDIQQNDTQENATQQIRVSWDYWFICSSDGRLSFHTVLPSAVLLSVILLNVAAPFSKLFIAFEKKDKFGIKSTNATVLGQRF